MLQNNNKFNYLTHLKMVEIDEEIKHIPKFI
jgi:hypothetical protein